MMAPTKTRTQLVPFGTAEAFPALIATSGECAAHSFLEFFTAQSRNLDTRRAYASEAEEFLAWCEPHGVMSNAKVQLPPVAATFVGTRRANTAYR
ncbi:MAG: hypothetical protein WBV25_00055 [Methylocella sp.]